MTLTTSSLIKLLSSLLAPHLGIDDTLINVMPVRGEQLRCRASITIALLAVSARRQVHRPRRCRSSVDHKCPLGSVSPVGPTCYHMSCTHTLLNELCAAC